MLVLRGGLFELPETASERTPRKKNAGRQKGGLLNEAALATAGDPLMALLMEAGVEEDQVAATPLPKDFKIRVRAVANGYGRFTPSRVTGSVRSEKIGGSLVCCAQQAVGVADEN